MDISKLQHTIVDALEDVKAQDIMVFDTGHLTSLFDRVIVASGTSNRQTRSLAMSVRDKVKKAGGEILAMEGLETGEWVLVDCNEAVVHIMQPMIREYYKLEQIWGEKPIDLAALKKLADEKTVKASKKISKTPSAKTTTTAKKSVASKVPAVKKTPAAKKSVATKKVAVAKKNVVAKKTTATKKSVVTKKAATTKKASAPKKTSAVRKVK